MQRIWIKKGRENAWKRLITFLVSLKFYPFPARIKMLHHGGVGCAAAKGRSPCNVKGGLIKLRSIYIANGSPFLVGNGFSSFIKDGRCSGPCSKSCWIFFPRFRCSGVNRVLNQPSALRWFDIFPSSRSVQQPGIYLPFS